ncbi:hypothetical protein ACPCG0_02660 [Propionibacteriaceae bacterium Y1923]
MNTPATPPLDCDIVMKGGITSGVIYPRAIAELAHTYRLRQVGGASAGAIAAAAAAAAELARQDPRAGAGGFAELDRMPQDLTAPGPDGRSTLATFFQPTRAAAPLFRVLHAVDGKSGAGAAMAAVTTLLRGYWLRALVGALVGVGVVLTGVVAMVRLGEAGSGSPPWVTAALVTCVVAGVLLAMFGLVASVLLGISRTAGRVAGEEFGLCTGMPGVDSGDAAALTPWLDAKIQSLAGRPSDRPVTFGDLAEHDITLQMMTTNLTRHQPMTMPWRTEEFFFDPVAMAELFPETVVTWMVDHPPALPTSAAARFDAELLRAQAGHLRPWPPAEHLPVVVATRMSLSFPVLIQAVRLQAIDWVLPVNRRARDAVPAWRAAHPGGTLEQALADLERPEFSDVWFTDGGLCSNLPVHFFDTPLPKHPTFAFNLAAFPPGYPKSPDEARNSFLPDRNASAMTRPWFGLPTGGAGSWVDFFMLMFATARSWVDGEQLVMAGYRDRIVTVHHDDAEGGMNLNMAPEVVTNLSLRGKDAAAKLVAAFAGDQPGVVPAAGWDNHRWIRFRTATAGLTGWLDQFQQGYRAPGAGGTPYPDLAGPGAAATLPSYRPTVGDRVLINQHTAEVVDLADKLTGDRAMTHGAPRPRPQLRLVPDDGTAQGLAEVDPGAGS